MKHFAAVALCIFLLFTACSSQSSRIDDIIQIQDVFSGDSTQIHVEDLFYAPSYSTLEFQKNPHLDITYDPSSGSLRMKANKDFSGFTSLKIKFMGQGHDIPVNVIRRKIIRFEYPSDLQAEKLAVFGNFNFWQRTQLMITKDADGVFYRDIAFDPGQYEYLFWVDGKEILDPGNRDSIPNGLGGYNSKLVVKPFFEGTRPFITPMNYVDKSRNRSFRFHILPNDYHGDFSIYDLVVLLDNQRISSSHLKIKGRDLSIKIKKDDCVAASRLRIMWSNHITRSNVEEVILEQGYPATNKGKFKWQDAIIYSIMPDRFLDADVSNNKPVQHGNLADRANFNGGDLQGIIQKVDESYFENLGVNTLWVLPFLKTTAKAYRETPAPHRNYTGYHGYWPADGRKVDPHFGDNAIVHTLVDDLHKRDMKILVDFVSNHVHEEHPYYQDHPEWFGKYILPDGRENLRLFDEYRLTTWFESYTPSFDYMSSPEAVNASVSDAVWWLTEYKLDGFRHDAVKHVPNFFWRSLTKAIRDTIKDRDVYQIGETFGDHSLVSSYVNNGQLSAQFNFNLYWPARYAFAVPGSSFSTLAGEMEKTLDVYGQLHLMGNMMDSHDQPRYAAYLEEDLGWGENAAKVGWNRHIEVDDPLTYDKIQLYMTYLMTIPGPPVVYYGDEIGMTGAADPDNRRMMVWKTTAEQRSLRDEISKLTALRSAHPALRYGDYFTLTANESCYAYLRRDFNESICVLIHRSAEDEEISIELPKDIKFTSASLLYGDGDIHLKGNSLTVKASDYSGYVISLK